MRARVRKRQVTERMRRGLCEVRKRANHSIGLHHLRFKVVQAMWRQLTGGPAEGRRSRVVPGLLLVHLLLLLLKLLELLELLELEELLVLFGRHERVRGAHHVGTLKHRLNLLRLSSHGRVAALSRLNFTRSSLLLTQLHLGVREGFRLSPLLLHEQHALHLHVLLLGVHVSELTLADLAEGHDERLEVARLTSRQWRRSHLVRR